MRILQVHNAYRERGGEDTVADAEADLLAGNGFVVRRVRTANPVRPLAAASRLAVSTWNPAAARRLGATIADFRPDIAHVHNTWYSLTASALAELRRAGIPTVMTIHNYRYTCINGQLLRDGATCELCVGRVPWQGLRHRCYRGSLPSSVMATAGVAAARWSWHRLVDRFIVTTDFARRVLSSAGLPEARIVVKPHHVPDPGERPAPPQTSKSALYVGRIAPEKGVDLLIEAWEKAGLNDYELTIVGDGPLRSRLSKIAPPTVRFTGLVSRDRVLRLMQEARLLLFPSIWYETFGLVMVEAMAAGTPVLASALGGTPDIVGGTDCLVAPGDVAAWAGALESRVPDDAWISDRGVAVRARYERAFTPEHALRKLVDIYSVSASRQD